MVCIVYVYILHLYMWYSSLGCESGSLCIYTCIHSYVLYIEALFPNNMQRFISNTSHILCYDDQFRYPKSSFTTLESFVREPCARPTVGCILHLKASTMVLSPIDLERLLLESDNRLLVNAGKIIIF